jgi:hypothetical protein
MVSQLLLGHDEKVLPESRTGNSREIRGFCRLALPRSIAITSIVSNSVIRNVSKSLRQRQSWSFLLGLLCLALVVLGSTIQVAHSHANGDIAHPDCSLCATAHVVAQVVAAPAALIAVATVASVPVASPQSQPSRPTVFALFTRPPPAVSTLA